MASASATDSISSAVTELLARLQRDANCLSDPDRNKRRRALTALDKALFESGAANPPAAVAFALVGQHLLRPVAGLLSDSSESNREAVLAFLHKALSADASRALHADMFPILLPAIASRIGRVPFAEEAEEIRLQLAQLLNALLAAPTCVRLIALQTRDVVDLLCAAATDAFHAVKVEVSAAMLHLVAAATRDSTAASASAGASRGSGGPAVDLAYHVSPLCMAFAPFLSHQRAPVRLAGLDALHGLLPLGGDGLERQLNETLLPQLRTHTRFDRTASVRKALAGSLAFWLRSLPWRALGAVLEGSLLSMLLGLIADEAAEVGAHAQQALAETASAVAASSSARKSSKGPRGGAGAASDVLAAAAAASVDDVAAMSLAGGGIESGDHHDDDADAAAAAASAASSGLPADAPLPAPLPLPLAAGARAPRAVIAYVASRLSGSLPRILEDLKDWTGRSRVFAAGALRSLLALAESSVTPHLSAIVGALCAGSRDEEADVRRILGEAGSLLGVFVPADEQLAVFLPQLRGEVPGANNAQAYTASLRVFAAAVATMPAAAVLPHLRHLADALSSPRLVEEEAPGLRRALAGALSSVVRAVLAGTPALASADGMSNGAAYAAAGSTSPAAAPAGGVGVSLETSLAFKHPAPGAPADADGRPARGRMARALSRALVLFDDEHSSTAAGAGAGSGSAAATDAALAGVDIDNDAAGGSGSAASMALDVGSSPGLLAALSDRAVLDPLLLLLLFLAEPASSDEVAAVAASVARPLSRALGFRHSCDLLASASSRLLAHLLADVATWGRGSYSRRVFDAFLRAARPALAGTSWAECAANIDAVASAFAVTLTPHKEADLRVAMLALLDAFLLGPADPSDDVTAGAGGPGSGAGVNHAAVLSGRLAAVAGGAGAGAGAGAGVQRVFSPPPADGASASAAGVSVTASSAGSGGSVAAGASLPDSVAHKLDAPPGHVMSSAEVAAAGHALAAGVARVHASHASAPGAGAAAASLPHDAGRRGAASDAAVDAALAAGASASIVRDALLPGLVWRAGGIAATLRKVSTACLYTLLRRGLLPAEGLSSLMLELLPSLKGALTDDDGTTRLLSLQCVACILRILYSRVEADAGRALYTELLKRLDDSADPVRLAACDSLRDLAGALSPAAGEDVRTGPAEHCLDALLIHVDDTDARVAGAAYEACMGWARLNPGYAVKAATAAKAKHRDPARASALAVAAASMPAIL